MTLFKKTTLVLMTLLLSFNLSACAVMKASNQPDKKNMNVLRPGTERVRVIAELGKPLNTSHQKGLRRDVFVFVQGYSKTNKTLRAVGHGLADVYTLGLWEVVGTPIEGANNGTKVQVEVFYDKAERVSNIKVLKGMKAVYPNAANNAKSK